MTGVSTQLRTFSKPKKYLSTAFEIKNYTKYLKTHSSSLLENLEKNEKFKTKGG